EVFPVAEIARLAHEHGAMIAVDAAQLAPHRAIDMVQMGIDMLAFSGHKMYAPFGAGALVGPSAILGNAEPMLAGGGAVTYVTLDDVQWAQPPDRLEAGSPNVIGAVALAAACEAHDIRERLRRGEHRDIPGAVRASFGLGTTVEHVDRLVIGLQTLLEKGPKLVYVEDRATGDYEPVDDRRTFPTFPFLPSLAASGHSLGCGQF